MPKSENREALDQLFRRLCADFGQASGDCIIRTIVEELGGLRVTVPDVSDLEREARDMKICSLFDGANYEELAMRFLGPDGHHLSVRQIRNIIDRQRPQRR